MRAMASSRGCRLIAGNGIYCGRSDTSRMEVEETRLNVSGFWDKWSVRRPKLGFRTSEVATEDS